MTPPTVNYGWQPEDRRVTRPAASDGFSPVVVLLIIAALLGVVIAVEWCTA